MSLYTVSGMGLLFVGAVLVVNGVWLLGRAADRDTAILNFLVGGLTLLIAVWWAFGGDASGGTPFNAAGELLFSFTYLWVGVNAYRSAEDQRSFGWYCIIVTLATIPTGYINFQLGDLGLAVLWWVWGVLWAGFWLLLALERGEYTNEVAWYAIAVGILTGISGYVMAAGFWPWAPA
jgi:hypothetical protein